MPFRLILIAALTLCVSACQTARGKREPVWPYPTQPSAPTSPAPSSSWPTPQSPDSMIPAPLPSPSEPVFVPFPESRPPLPEFPKTAEAISGAAVVSLLKQARASSDMGKPEQAQAALERALRIEPRNYFVLSVLAGTYLEQKNYAQAITLARKSNSLARGNFYAELENYRLIAAAAEASGNASMQVQAQARMDEIQRLLQSAAD